MLHFIAGVRRQLAGHRADLEAHLVHESAEGDLAVLAVLFDVVDDPMPIDAYIAPPDSPPSIHHLDRILPTPSSAFRYMGSRTTPPFATGIRWTVFTRRLTVGRAALATFADRYGPNIRELQDRSETEVTLG